MRPLAPFSSAGLILLALAAPGCKGGCDQAGAEQGGSAGSLSAPSRARFGNGGSCPNGSCPPVPGGVAAPPERRDQAQPPERARLPAFTDRGVADAGAQPAPATVVGRAVGPQAVRGPEALKGPPPPTHSGVKELRTQAEFDAALRTGTPMVVDWYGNSCPPCMRLMRPYQEAAAVLDGQVAFYKVNVETEGAPRLPRGGGIPQLAYFENGALVTSRNGLPPGVQMSGLKDWLVGALADRRLE